jgi:hypothetical protein
VIRRRHVDVQNEVEDSAASRQHLMQVCDIGLFRHPDTANITLEEGGARALNWTGLPIEEYILGMSLEFPLESRSCISFRESSQGVQSQRGRG